MPNTFQIHETKKKETLDLECLFSPYMKLQLISNKIKLYHLIDGARWCLYLFYTNSIVNKL